MKVEGHDIKPPNKMGIDAFINCGLQDYVTEKNPPHKGIPCLCQKLRFRTVNSQSDITGAWQGIIEQYQDFRQRRYGNKYGLSQWPEANEVRRYYKKPHKLPADIEDDALIEKFPRAKFGLPIEFHMPHDGDMKPQLQGINYDPDNDKWYNRLASPLILRPIACSDGAVGLAAILEWQPMEADDEPYTPPGGLILKGAPGDPAVSSELTQAEAKVILPLHGNTDILQAFLDSLR